MPVMALTPRTAYARTGNVPIARKRAAPCIQAKRPIFPRACMGCLRVGGKNSLEDSGRGPEPEVVPHDVSRGVSVGRPHPLGRVPEDDRTHFIHRIVLTGSAVATTNLEGAAEAPKP